MSNFQLPPGMTPSAPPSGGGGGGGGGAGQPSAEDQAKAAQQEEMKRSMIAAMLAPEARERREWTNLASDVLFNNFSVSNRLDAPSAR